MIHSQTFFAVFLQFFCSSFGAPRRKIRLLDGERENRVQHKHFLGNISPLNLETMLDAASEIPDRTCCP